MAKPVESVYFNNGKDANCFALVLADKGDTKLDLLVFSAEGVASVARNVARREPADYGPEGGGDTWHS